MAYFSLRQICLLLLIGLTVMGCDRAPNHPIFGKPDDVCRQHPELCQDLEDDEWCSDARRDVISSRLHLKEEGTDRRKYQLMRHLERYLMCVENAISIEYTRGSGKNTPRVEGMLAASRQLAQLDEATRHSPDPYLLLWHWGNNTNELARQQFLALEGSPQLEEPDLQLVLAGTYAKHNATKAIAILHHGLSLYREGDKINSRLLTSLSTLYMGQKQYGLAYLWGKVSKSFQDANAPEVSAERFGIYHSLRQAELAGYDEQAAVIVQQIKLGNYQN